MARRLRCNAFPTELVSNILGRLDARDVARGQSVCARWHKAGRAVKSLQFTEETFPEGMAPEAALTIMTNMIMQATELEHLDITHVSTAGLPDSLLTAWFLKLRPTLVSFKSTNIYSFEQTLAGVRHPTIARHVGTHLQWTPLRHLSLTGAELPLDTHPLPLLESLELSDVSATSAGLTKFISGCGALVSLTLADLDGLNCIKVKSTSLRHVSISGEMNSVSFDVHLGCPNLRTLAIKSISLRSAQIGFVPQIESISLEDVSGGPIAIVGTGKSLRSVILRGVTWQHVGAVIGSAEGKEISCLEIDGVTGPDVWTEEDDSLDSEHETDTDTHMVRPRSHAPASPVELELLSDTEEAFDVQTPPKVALPLSVAGGLPTAIASFQNLETLRLGAGVWSLCGQGGISDSDPRQPTKRSAFENVKFARLREFGVLGATVGKGVAQSVVRMVGMCPALQKLILCGELGKSQLPCVPPPLSRLSSSGSSTSVNSAALLNEGSFTPELVEGSENSTPTFRKGALARFSPASNEAGHFVELEASSEGDVCMTEDNVAAFSTKFAAQAMALQRKYPKLVVDIHFRNSTSHEVE